jgi:hypothetical protein
MTPPIASLEEDGSLSLESLTLSADAIPRGGRVGSVLIDLMLRYGGIVPPHILNLILVAQPASGTLALAGPEHLRAYCILGGVTMPSQPDERQPRLAAPAHNIEDSDGDDHGCYPSDGARSNCLHPAPSGSGGEWRYRVVAVMVFGSV